jgi:hypothetical protein
LVKLAPVAIRTAQEPGLRTLWSSRLAILALAALAAGAPSAAAESEPVVVEVFVSQACGASPPAFDYAAELGRRSDLIALVYHVDYWNILSTRKHGRWKDPYGHPSFSARQRIYNRKIRGRTTLRTPQAFVNGRGVEVGSNREGVEELIALERGEPRLARTEVTRAGSRITASVDAEGNDLREVILVIFRNFASTDVTGGENFGRRFDEPHVVTEIRTLGDVTHRRERFEFDAPPDGMGCAVLVQERGQGVIVGARYCP